MRSTSSDYDLPYTVHRLANGWPYIRLANGRILSVPSGGEDPPGPVQAAKPAAEPPPTEPKRIPWDSIDWDQGPKLDRRNLPKAFQDVLNGILADDRRKHEERHSTTREELQKAQETQTQLQERLAEMEEALRALTEPPPKAGADPTRVPPGLAKHPELAKVWTETVTERLAAEDRAKKYEQQLAELDASIKASKAELEKEREQRTKAEQRVLDRRRENEVLAVLSKLNVIDPRRELALYAGRAEYNADRDSFAYRNANGDVVPLEEGIKADLPPYVLRPEVTNGGSGAHGAQGGAPRPEPPLDKRQRLAQEHAALREKVSKGQRLTAQEQTKLLQLGRELKELNASA